MPDFSCRYILSTHVLKWDIITNSEWCPTGRSESLSETTKGNYFELAFLHSLRILSEKKYTLKGLLERVICPDDWLGFVKDVGFSDKELESQLPWKRIFHRSTTSLPIMLKEWNVEGILMPDIHAGPDGFALVSHVLSREFSIKIYILFCFWVDGTTFSSLCGSKALFISYNPQQA